MLASPSTSNISYYNSSENKTGVACKNVEEVRVYECATNWSSSGIALWYFGTVGDSGSTNYYKNYLRTSADSQDICYISDGVGDIADVRYATSSSDCLTYSSTREYVNLTDTPVTYYQPTGEKINSTIGYRPVITVLKK